MCVILLMMLLQKVYKYFVTNIPPLKISDVHFMNQNVLVFCILFKVP